MIGSTLKKYALENGLKVSGGIAYGNFRGYSSYLCEGSGWKMLGIKTRIPEESQMTALVNQLQDKEITKQYRLREVRCQDGDIRIMFTDTIGTMKRFEAFMEWFFPILNSTGATRYNTCDSCGLEMSGNDQWMIVDDAVYHVHTACAEKMSSAVRYAEEKAREEDQGSYLSGLVGAVLGALLGGVIWAVIYVLGYFAAAVGMVIALLAVKGYDLLHGKQGKAKILIVVLAVILGVVAGTFGAYCWQLLTLVRDGTLMLTVADIPAFSIELLRENAELSSLFLRDVGLGLFFGLLGSLGIVLRTAKSVSKAKITTLE